MDSKHTTSLSLETVRRIAELSRLAISAEEEIIFQKELEKILNAFQALTQVEIPNESANSRSAFILQDALQANTVSRLAADVPNNSLSTKTFMDNTPDSEGVFVRVPAILNAEH